ncbi:MAG: nuclear transport factor 2 family protein [Candidatus Omnitrophica bacterium]|nr:nuclear transport factor 2 family protein [Candidatus Omnitrophota bacterium]
MEPILNPKKIVEEYFRIWESYDLAGLMHLFDENAKYEITPINKILNGHVEICEYWNRNAKRQQGLELSWHFIYIKKSYVRVNFNAKFYDNEEKEHQNITGIIEFYLKKNNVTLLSETYTKSIVGDY